jgi:hypothetical protein
LFSSGGIKSRKAKDKSGIERYGWHGYIYDLAGSPEKYSTIAELRALQCLEFLDHQATVTAYKNAMLVQK